MSTSSGPRTGSGNASVDNQHDFGGRTSLEITSLDDLWKLSSASDWSRVRMLDLIIQSAESALALRLALSDLNMKSLELLKITARCSTGHPNPLSPLRSPNLRKASLAAIFIDLDAPALTELDITYDPSEPHRPSVDALLSTLDRSPYLRRLELSDCLPVNSEWTGNSLCLHFLERITLAESTGSQYPRCSSFLRVLSFPPSTEQHLSTVDIEDALDLLRASAQRIWVEDTPIGVQLVVKSGYIGFSFYLNVQPHGEKDDTPLDGAKLRAEISLGVKAHHLPPLMYALASSVDLSTVTTLSLRDDTSPRSDDDGAHWRSVFDSFAGVRVLHLADTRGAPQPLLLLALGAQTESAAYVENRRSPTPPDDRDSSGNDSEGTSSYESGASYSDANSDTSSGSSRIGRARFIPDPPAPNPISTADEEITPFPMLAERLRQLQQTIFLELDHPNPSHSDLPEPQALDDEEARNPVDDGLQEVDVPANENDTSQLSGTMDDLGQSEDEMEISSNDEHGTPTREALVLPSLDVLWLASHAEDRPVSAYTFPLEALVRALTSRAKSHAKKSASRSPRTLRIDVAVALREPGVTEPHLLEARVRFPNILWRDGQGAV